MRVVAAIFALFALGCTSYVVVTYALVLARKPRSLAVAAVMRAALVELCVTLTLLPFTSCSLLRYVTCQAGGIVTLRCRLQRRTCGAAPASTLTASCENPTVKASASGEIAATALPLGQPSP